MQKEHLEALLEDINGKFDLVLEGNYTIWQEVRGTRQELSEKIEMNSILIKALNAKAYKLQFPWKKGRQVS